MTLNTKERIILGFISLVLSSSAMSVVIDNDKSPNQGGYFSVDLTPAGETRTVRITDPSLSYREEDIAFEYLSYVNVAGTSVRLADNASSVNQVGANRIESSGSFTGSNSNTINWRVSSAIAVNTLQMRSVYTFSVDTGTLGNLEFIQYLDEDVIGENDDFFFTRGTSAAANIELYTIDNDDPIALGISHSGAQKSEQGLINAEYAGWAVCSYGNRQQLLDGNFPYQSEGTVCSQLTRTSTHPDAGAVLGRADIVSSMAWRVSPDQKQAVIVTTLGGVPDVGVAVAADDYGTVTENNTETNFVEINVLDNDVALDLPVVADNFSDPSDGSISVDGAVVRYTPNTTFFGEDTFTYQITDKSGDSSTATVRITVLEDSDGDNVSNLAEAENGTNPNNPDTDGDGKTDGEEGTADSDGDGIIDALEASNKDADNDGVPDEQDSSNTDGTNDTDGDGISNSVEVTRGTDPLKADTDGDGKNDFVEGTIDTDNDGVIDALESATNDTDNDGVSDELDAENNNPHNDTDGDGISNAHEVVSGTDPQDSNSTPIDTDGDKVPDIIDLDDDNDGLTDLEEENSVPPSNPTDACDPSNRHDQCDFDKDGVKNGLDADDDGDGIPDITDPDSAQFCIPDNSPATCDDFNEQVAIAELIEDLNGNDNRQLLTLTELKDIRGVVGIIDANMSEYNTAFIPAEFSNIDNPTVAEINAVIAKVNTIVANEQEALAELVEDVTKNNANGKAVTADQLNNIRGVSGAIAENEAEYLKAFQATTPSPFSDPENPTPTEIQKVIDAVNTIVANEKAALAELVEDVTKNNANGKAVTAEQLNNIRGVSGAIAANEAEYLAAFQATTPSPFADPENPTPAEIQEVIDAVNTIVANEKAALAELVEDVTKNNANGKAVTAEQLNNIRGVSGAIAENQAEYLAAFQATTPLPFADPENPTPEEIQKVIDAVNTIVANEKAALAELVEDVNRNNANGKAVTAEQLNNIRGVSGAIAENEAEYLKAFQATTPSPFSDPENPTPTEIQKVIDAVNTIVANEKAALAELVEDVTQKQCQR